jgi:hypothetical protein
MTESENEINLIRIEGLMDKGDGRTPEEGQLLERLKRLSADFEAAHYNFEDSEHQGT